MPLQTAPAHKTSAAGQRSTSLARSSPPPLAAPCPTEPPPHPDRTPAHRAVPYTHRSPCSPVRYRTPSPCPHPPQLESLSNFRSLPGSAIRGSPLPTETCSSPASTPAEHPGHPPPNPPAENHSPPARAIVPQLPKPDPSAT